jgi:hypothetical protein
VGRHDLAEEALGRLQVVVVPVDADRGQALGLLGGQDPGADGHVDPHLLLHLGDQLFEAGHRPLVRAPHGQHDAELRGPQGLGLPGGLQHLAGVQERGGLNGGVEVGRLRAEVAVLGAAARLGRQDPFDLDGRPVPGQPDLVGQRGQGGDVLVGQLGQRGQDVHADGAPFVEQDRPGHAQRVSDHGAKRRRLVPVGRSPRDREIRPP